MALGAAPTLSSAADASPNNSASRRQHRSVFVSPGTSPTRYGVPQVINSSGHQRPLATGRLSPMDRTSPLTIPVDPTEAGRKSRTLPLPGSKLLAVETGFLHRTDGGASVDDDLATSGVIPKPLSRHELTDTDLDVGSVVEFDIGSERHYGVIRWIGYLSNNKKHVIVGIELVNKLLSVA